jgi:type III secretion protein Q
MKAWTVLDTLSAAQARDLGTAAALLASNATLVVNKRRFTCALERPRERYPLGLSGTCGGDAFTLHLDAGAADARLSADLLGLANDALARVQAALEPWLDLLEAHAGGEIALHALTPASSPVPGCCALAITDALTQRRAHVALEGAAPARWLAARRAQGAPRAASGVARCRVPVRVCLAGPRLALARIRGIATGDVLVLRRDASLLLPSHAGSLVLRGRVDGNRIMLEESLNETSGASWAPVDAIALPVDAVIATLTLSIAELAALQPGAVLPIPVPADAREVTLLCQGVPFARGEIVQVGEFLGVRVHSVAGNGAAP